MTLNDLRKIKDVPNPVYILSSELAFIEDFGILWEEKQIVLIQDNTTNLPLTLDDLIKETKPCPDNTNIIVRTHLGRIVEGSLSLCNKDGFFMNIQEK